MSRRLIAIGAAAGVLGLVGLLLLDRFPMGAAPARPDARAARSPVKSAVASAYFSHSEAQMPLAESPTPSPAPLSLSDGSLAKRLEEVAAGWSALSAAEGTVDDVPYERRLRALQAFVERIPDESVPGAFAMVGESSASLPAALARELQVRLVQREAKRDPAVAAGMAGRMGAAGRAEACEYVAAQWARSNADDAEEWARQLPADSRRGALLAIAYAVATDDPKKSLLLASETAVPPEKHDVITRAITVWAAEQPAEAADWARRIPDRTLREQALSAVVIVRADREPRAAAEMALQALSDQSIRKNAILGIMQRLAVKEEKTARAWAEQFPPDMRASALDELRRMKERARVVSEPSE